MLHAQKENGMFSVSSMVRCRQLQMLYQTSVKSVAYVNGVSESCFCRGLCLPSDPMVSDADVERIVNAINNCIAFDE